MFSSVQTNTPNVSSLHLLKWWKCQLSWKWRKETLQKSHTRKINPHPFLFENCALIKSFTRISKHRIKGDQIIGKLYVKKLTSIENVCLSTNYLHCFLITTWRMMKLLVNYFKDLTFIGIVCLQTFPYYILKNSETRYRWNWALYRGFAWVTCTRNMLKNIWHFDTVTVFLWRDCCQYLVFINCMLKIISAWIRWVMSCIVE